MMTLTQDKFKEFKKEYAVYGVHEEVDEYMNEQLVMDADPKFSVKVMITPVTDSVYVDLYGQDVKKMFQFVLYDNEDVREHDRMIIDEYVFEIVSVKKWNTHRVVLIKRLLEKTNE